MGKRSKVVSATALMLVGGLLVIARFVGGSDLQAAGLDQTGLDFSRYLIWGGAGALLISAVLFISASAE
ncbi:MAG: hypothetical protein WEC81_00675 [Patescibacteria group bacterium]